MQDFKSMFPHFLQSCLDLKRVLTPIAYLLLTGGLMATVITTHRSGSANLRTFGRMIIFTAFLVFLPTWGNSLVSFVDDTVKNILKADPSKVFDQYNAALELKKAAGANKNWWEKIMDWRAAPLEWITTAIFFYLGWLASAIMWWAYILQSAILFMGYALSPIFIGFLAFPAVHESGRRYLLHLVGVMLWPLGWGFANLITQGMIDFMTDRSFLVPSEILGNQSYTLQNLMGLAFLGVWIIFSTITAPLFIQRAIQTGAPAAANLLSGAFGAARAAFSSGASTLAIAGQGQSGGGLLKAGAVAAATAGETLAGFATGNGGSLIGSLAQTKSSQSSGVNRPSKRQPFPKNDPTGDKTVATMLRKTQNPYS